MSDDPEKSDIRLDPDFFPHPTNFPGAATRTLSPNDVWDLAEPCGPHGVITTHFGLTEDEVTSISKRGIRICGHDFTSPYLMPWTTAGDPPPNNLFIRYDRALAARGVLREAELLLEHTDGVREVVAVCHRDVKVAERSSVAEFRRVYRRFVREISTELEFQEDQYRRLEVHRAALEEFYHPVPVDGPDRIPIRKVWEDADPADHPTDDRQDDALTALHDGRTESSVDSATAGRRQTLTDAEGGPDPDTVAEMLGGPAETQSSVDPEAHPKHTRRSR